VTKSVCFPPQANNPYDSPDGSGLRANHKC
jgi:hypothetical protein